MIDWNASLLSLAAIMFVALVGSLAARRFRKSPLIFYILLGIAAGNLFFRGAQGQSYLEPLANLGITFLLFTLGLEFSFERLRRSGKLVLKSSVGQIVTSGAVISLLLFIWLKNLPLALVLGFGLGMSSTAIIAKVLAERGEESSLTGEITLSTLLLQDMASVILITILTLMGGTSLTVWGFIGEILAKVLVIGFSFVVLSQLVDWGLSRLKLNREELSLFVFGSIFALIGFFTLLKIPETTAGFLIGVILSNRREQSEIFSQVRVFRDVLLVLFFFFLGFNINTFNLGLIIFALGLSLVLMLLKFVTAYLLYLIEGLHSKTAFWVAFDLMQIGEFAFVLITIALQRTLLPNSTAQVLLLTTIWSLLIYNLIYRRKMAFYRVFSRVITKWKFFNRLTSTVPKMVFDQLNYQDHIVLCGYGRVGNYLGHGLVLSKLPVVVVDTNAEFVSHLLKKGVKAIYGDATEPDILDYAEVDKAKFLIISLPNPQDQEQIILEAKRLNPHISIITRTHLSHELRHFKALGVDLIFQPEFEAALSMLKRILKLYNVEKAEITKRLRYLKMEHGTEG
jgi:CPA2 family monovalent cation:H+ antiporter-2